MEIKFQFWLEQNGGVVLDQRCGELLKAMDELHSLFAATKRHKMSYRSAWGKLRSAEKKLGFNLLMSSGHGRGMRLTPEGKVLLNKFDKLQRDMTALFLSGADRHFSAECAVAPRDDSRREGSKYESQRKAAVLRSLRTPESCSRTIGRAADTA